ncbi:MAG: T9SS type A sorting domain-containing protein [Bacteroidales bacterium]|nr:T9SS type A sorting domain-containing protein [Bacteroidales bacterium]
MKYLITIFLLLSTFPYLNAQTFEIYFAGKGEATVVDSVIIENLNQAISITIKGSDVLRLGNTTGIYDKLSDVNLLQVFPNPFTEQAEIEFSTNSRGTVLVAVHDMSGRVVLQSIRVLNPGKHIYRITGLNQGMYIVKVNIQGTVYTAKLLNCNNLNVTAGLFYLSSDENSMNQTVSAENRLKTTTGTIGMKFNAGDRLKLTGMSGSFSTVLTIVPASDTSLAFGFVKCTDADSNHYPVVTIGTQTWMETNLETTRYNDNTPIPLAADSAQWALRSTPAYCWFNNDSMANKDIYGALYNWFTVDAASNGGKNICPTGWHVPADGEWKILTDFLGGEAASGSKLKETGTEHWIQPNTGANNETGFTALGAGWRGSYGLFLHFNMYGVWWSTSEYNTGNALYREMYYDNSGVFKYDWYKPCGFSVRCVKD